MSQLEVNLGNRTGTYMYAQYKIIKTGLTHIHQLISSQKHMVTPHGGVSFRLETREA